MKIAIAGATGRIGALTVELLERLGHDVVRLSRSHGVDLLSGSDLAGRLAGVDAVIDVTNVAAATDDEAVERFGTITQNLVRAAAEAGVEHHVLLSILGLDRVGGNPHYAGKREQERLVTTGPVPWTIVRASQFHDFAEMVAGWHERDGVTTVPPLLLQPIAPREVAQTLVETALAEPLGGRVDLAGPEPQDMVDMARRTYEARGRTMKLIPSWSTAFGPSMAGDVLLPTDDARRGRVTFDEWLAEQVVARHTASRQDIVELVDAAVRHQFEVEPFLDLHADEVVVVNIAGRRVLGRDELGSAMRRALASPLADVSTAVEIDDICFLTPDVALVSCTKRVTDGRADAEEELPSVGAMTYVVVDRGDRWQIALAQTTPIRPPAPTG